MPPASKKQKRAEPPPRGSAAGAAAGGRQEPGMAPPPQSAARGLQTGVVKEFLQSIQRRDRLGPDFFNDAEKQQWDEWLDSVPADAAHSTDAQKLLPVQMPPKCLPRNTAGRSTDAATSMSQQEIIAYSNAGGRQFQPADRQRQHAASKPLCSADVAVGSTVAIRRAAPASGDTFVGGYGTLFYVGDVLETTCGADGVVQKLLIQYRMPQGRDSLFCDDMTKPWNLACLAQHRYDGQCKRRLACKRAALAAGADDSRFVYTCDAAEVFETQLSFNDSRTLQAKCKKKLVESAPEGEADEWRKRLGL